MHPVSQIVERNLHRLEACESGLWINPEKDGCWQNAIPHCPELELLSQDYGSYEFLRQSGAKTEFSAFPADAGNKHQWIMLNLPRQKALLDMMLACAAPLLAKDGSLWLAGEKRAGVKSSDKILQKHFGIVRKLDNARHCGLYEARNSLVRDKFDPLAYREEWLLDYKPTEIRVASYPGIFAHGRLDAGTALLLSVLADFPAEGTVLDFACGAGVVGAFIAACNPHAVVTLLDSNALALRASRETLNANNLDGFVLASDGLSNLEASFDLIVSNPPIHAGVKTDNRLSTRLLESVHDHLNPGGSLIMVANVHLPYEKWLSKGFRRCSQLAENSNYKVILASR